MLFTHANNVVDHTQQYYLETKITSVNQTLDTFAKIPIDVNIF